MLQLRAINQGIFWLQQRNICIFNSKRQNIFILKAKNIAYDKIFIILYLLLLFEMLFR